MVPILRLGRTRPLEPEDVPGTDPAYGARALDAQFSTVLNEYLAQNHKHAILYTIIRQFKGYMIEIFVFYLVIVFIDMLSAAFILVIVDFLYN
jgi:hypothetical protein